MSLLNRIAEHSRARDLRSVSVPEWGDDDGPLVIYFTMVTLGDLAEARRAAGDDPVRLEAEIVCMKAAHADGRPMFRRIEVLELMEVADPMVFRRIANEMMPHQSKSEAAKN